VGQSCSRPTPLPPPPPLLQSVGEPAAAARAEDARRRALADGDAVAAVAAEMALVGALLRAQFGAEAAVDEEAGTISLALDGQEVVVDHKTGKVGVWGGGGGAKGGGCWVLGAGCWVLGAGCWVLGQRAGGWWVLGARCRVPGALMAVVCLAYCQCPRRLQVRCANAGLGARIERALARVTEAMRPCSLDFED
jgi:hypothetical protein